MSMGIFRKTFRIILVIIAVITLTCNIYIYQYDRIRHCSWPFGLDQTSIRLLAFGDPQITGTNSKTPLRKQLDVYGNDHFLGHIYKVMLNHKSPTHLAVMGDLLSSQWINDEEFSRRIDRYKNRIFIDPPVDIFNVSGNHDIGYHGEMTDQRVSRFVDKMSPLNFETRYETNNHPWRIIVINSLALDGPGFEKKFAKETKDFLRHLKKHKFNGFTILLQHVPLSKTPGLCRDQSLFIYDDDGYLRSQNHLSEESSHLILDSVFGQDNHFGGIILTGHDHVGCDSQYIYDKRSKTWINEQPNNEHHNPRIIREIVVRSMMGEFGGNTGMLGGIFNETVGRFQFQYTLCPIGVQHIWWFTKIISYVFFAAVSISAFIRL